MVVFSRPVATAATLRASEPKYTYMIVPGNMPIHEAGTYDQNFTPVRP